MTILVAASAAACVSHGGPAVTGASPPTASHAASAHAAPAVSLLAAPNVRAACPAIAAAPSGSDPLAKLSANKILMDAGTDAAAEPTVCVSTPAIFQGTQLTDPATVVLASVRGGRCEGTVTVPGGGFATVIEIGSATWVWADQAYARYLALQAKGQTSEEVSARVGKWVRAGKLNPATSGLLDECLNPYALFAQMTAPSTSPSFQDTRAGFTMIDGQRTVGITNPLGSVTYVSDTTRPLPAGESLPGVPGVALDYFDFGIPATFSAPPASDVAADQSSTRR
ncbi:MAG: hypothetical protein JWM19_2787 [Actinomycetia bacterium]|nr:hypothetical protein [Actinomycetes bacterium]